MSDNIPNRQMCQAVKSKLVVVLIELEKINSELEDKKRFGTVEMQYLTIKIDEWKDLLVIKKNQKEVLKDIAETYRELFILNGCGCGMKVEEIECRGAESVAQYDYKKYNELKISLLNLLETIRKLYKSLKDKLIPLKIRKKYNEPQDEVDCAEQSIQPEMIEKLTEDIADQFDTVLRNCKEVWEVKEQMPDTHDSGYTSGNKSSQEADNVETLQILSVTDGDGDLLISMGQAATRRRISPVEHDEFDEEQTNVKVMQEK